MMWRFLRKFPNISPDMSRRRSPCKNRTRVLAVQFARRAEACAQRSQEEGTHCGSVSSLLMSRSSSLYALSWSVLMTTASNRWPQVCSISRAFSMMSRNSSGCEQHTHKHFRGVNQLMSSCASVNEDRREPWGSCCLWPTRLEVFPGKAARWRWCRASGRSSSAPSAPEHRQTKTGKTREPIPPFGLGSGFTGATHLRVQTEHADFSSVDDLPHGVCAGPVQVLLKLTGLDQLPWDRQSRGD